MRSDDSMRSQGLGGKWFRELVVIGVGYIQSKKTSGETLKRLLKARMCAFEKSRLPARTSETTLCDPKMSSRSAGFKSCASEMAEAFGGGRCRFYLITPFILLDERGEQVG